MWPSSARSLEEKYLSIGTTEKAFYAFLRVKEEAHSRHWVPAPFLPLVEIQKI